MTDSVPVETRLARLESLPEGAAGESVILAALEDESPVVRERAIRLATRYIEPKMLGKLVADELNAARRNAAITALERQGPYAVSHLQSMLHQYELDVVMFALQILARIGDASSAASIIPFVRHLDLNVAQAAVEALGCLRSREAVPELVELLNGKLWLQLAAIEALGQIGDPRAVGPLLELVPDSVVAEPAVRALQRIGAPESLGLLLVWLPRVAEPSLRDALLRAIGTAIEHHPDPASLARTAVLDLGDAAKDVADYLDEILQTRSVTLEDDRKLVRSAAALAAVSDFTPLFPAVLVRVATDPPETHPEDLLRANPAALSRALPGLLQHPDPRVRRGALLAGSFDRDSLPLVLDQLADADELVRAAACRALGSIESAEAVSLLIERLQHGCPAERAAAAEALGRMPADTLAAVEPCLSAGVPEEVMVAALQVFGSRTGAPFEARILELTRHRSVAVRRAALRAAGRLTGSRADVVLLRALADRDQSVQVEALDVLIQRGGHKVIDMLTALLASGDSLRCHLIRALGHLKAREAAARLQSLYPECGTQEQMEILLALTKIAPPGVAGFLLSRLEEPRLEIRRLAAQGFAAIADRDHLPRLQALAQDTDWNIRNAAALGFGLVGAPECQDTLLTLVRDVEPIVAQTARRALDRVRGNGQALSA